MLAFRALALRSGSRSLNVAAEEVRVIEGAREGEDPGEVAVVPEAFDDPGGRVREDRLEIAARSGAFGPHGQVREVNLDVRLVRVDQRVARCLPEMSKPGRIDEVPVDGLARLVDEMEDLRLRVGDEVSQSHVDRLGELVDEIVELLDRGDRPECPTRPAA